MATLDPTIPYDYSTSLPLVDSRSLIVFQDLSNHIESFSNDELVQNGTIVCTPCNETQKDYLLAFYATNKNISFQYVNPHDGETYTLFFLSPPPTAVRIPAMIELYSVVFYVKGTKNA